MAAFDINQSLERARRLGLGSTRAARSDRGSSRFDPRVVLALHDAVSGQERPRMKELLLELRLRCRPLGLAAPSRATVYNLLPSIPCPTRRKVDLPKAVQSALYNFTPESDVPLHQIAFCCFNYGDLEAVSFASGLPWLALYQARRTRGHRPKSAGLLDAAMRARRI